ncbi:MAG: HK97 family phage prohead protease [Pseudomonadota bacterium]
MSDGLVFPRPDERALGERALADRVLVSAEGVFEGYASVFGRCDQGADVVERGAFRRSLAARGPCGVKMLFQHDPNQPIGFWNEIKEDGRGLYVRGQLLTQVMRGHEVWALMRAGVLDGLSIGFKAVKARRDRGRGVRRLEVVDLWEISVVTFPMLEAARVGHVKRHGHLRENRGAFLQSPGGPASRGVGSNSVQRVTGVARC